MVKKKKAAAKPSNGIRILDGAYAPLLFAAGAEPTRPLAEAVLNRADAVEAAHRAFVEAGADVIVTVTADANAPALTRHDLADNAERITRAAVEIARKAAGKAMVFGAIGPSRQMLALEETSVEDLGEAFEAQARWLLDAGVDGIVIEAMVDLREAVAAVEAVRRVGKAPLAACMTFLPGVEAFTTAVDVEPPGAAHTLDAAGADWIGCHSGVALTESRALLDELAAATKKPLWVRLDVADPEYKEKVAAYRQPPAEFAEALSTLADLPIGVVGGAAGCTPAHVAALKAATT